MAGRLVTQSQEAALVLQSTQAQLAEVTERLKSKDQELDRLRRNDLRPCGEPSGKHACRDALSQANDTIRDRDIELLKLQNQMLREKMENEAYRQQLETRELRENMAKLEQLVAQSMDTLGPGVFKIINAASDTALTVSEGNSGRVFCWERHQGVTQRWFMQPSGSGWRIKNYGTGEYLTVSNTNNVSEVYCGKYPISWELAQGPEDHDMYIDNPEEEAQLFSREIALKDRWLAEKDQQLVLKGQQLADRGEQLADERRQLLEMAGRLAIQGKEIERIEVDRRRIQDQLAGVTERLAAKDQELDRLRRNSPGSSRRSAERTSGDAPSQFNDTVERLELQIQALREGLENETSRQQREIAELREKVTNLEGLLAQLNRDTVQPNNSID
ncbi:hypothetical protein FRC10_004808 [Ceratobasidium sp. 414]|nr:hypothetical protein FRC10_004808 [Ceratobasidium sp. 414]